MLKLSYIWKVSFMKIFVNLSRTKKNNSGRILEKQRMKDICNCFTNSLAASINASTFDHGIFLTDVSEQEQLGKFACYYISLTSSGDHSCFFCSKKFIFPKNKKYAFIWSIKSICFYDHSCWGMIFGKKIKRHGIVSVYEFSSPISHTLFK